MREFNKEDFDKVKHLEKQFTTATQSRFCTGLNKGDLDTLDTIYKDVLGKTTNLSCAGCVLQMVVSIGRLYFSYKDKEVINKENKDKKNERSKKPSVKAIKSSSSSKSNN